MFTGTMQFIFSEYSLRRGFIEHRRKPDFMKEEKVLK